MTATVAQVYRRLSPNEQARCALFCSNYGEAGALRYYGRRYGLPEAISGHNNFFLWGPGDREVEVVITVGESREEVEQSFDDVEQAATLVHEYAMPYESDLPVFVCRRPKKPFKDLWPNVKKVI
jgi:hypothetical protein